MRKFSVLMLFIMLALSAAACGEPATMETPVPTEAPTAAPTIVTFTDPVLEARVREAIGKPEGHICF